MEKIWLQHYQEGVPATVDPAKYTSLLELFEETYQEHKNQAAFSNMGTSLTFREVEQLSSYLGAYLQSIGLKKGARVGIMMPNVLQYPVALFAILRAGYVVVNINPLYTSDELKHQVNDAKAEAIIILANFAATLEAALPELTSLKHIIITQLGDLFPKAKKLAVHFITKHVKKMVPPHGIAQTTPFTQALRQGKRHTLQPVALTHQDTAFLQYTGGTTGTSQGAILTHENMIANILQASAWIAPMRPGPRDIIITALPLYHIFSLTANCLTFFKAGATNVLITNPRDIKGFVRAIKRIKFTAITGVNTLFNALLSNPKFKEVDFSHLKLALSGGMALQESVAHKWQTTTNAPILEAYGLTETSPAVTINPLYVKKYNGSVGLPLPSTDIAIRDDDGQDLPMNTAGELCVKGPQVTPGYWQQPDATNLLFWPDGFLRTGDIAKVDEKGFVYLVDRKKDMIVVSGFNVYPNEVEQVISMMPGVSEVGVIGVVEDNRERVKACIVKRDPSLQKEDIIMHTKQHLTAYKIPKIIEFYDELPKTNVGKILRRALR